MKRIMPVIIFSTVFFLVLGEEKQPADINQSGDISVLVKSSNDFAFELYGKLSSMKGNLFFSPYSVSTALAMVYAGAKGQTEKEMADVLKVPVINEYGCSGQLTALWPQERYHASFGAIIKNLNEQGQKGSYELAVANALWGQKGYGFLNEFVWLIEKNYQGGLNQLDFINQAEQARQTINQWVELQTREKIKDLIKQGVLDADTRLVLTNAIYFKGKWENQFKKEKTASEQFYLPDDSTKTVSMMKQTEQVKYLQAENFEAVELAYKEQDLSMVIFLPAKGASLDDFERNFSEKQFSQWQNLFTAREVEVHLPRFTLTWEQELGKVLKSMGMANSFTSDADFSGMTGHKELFISEIVHKAFVQVNEEGTEAAAATGVVMRLTSVQPKPIVFRADRPFIFIIKDNLSGSVLFIGRIVEPQE